MGRVHKLNQSLILFPVLKQDYFLKKKTRLDMCENRKLIFSVRKFPTNYKAQVSI